MTEEHFSMPIEDVFSIKGRGTVVIGQVQSGRLFEGQSIYLTNGIEEIITEVVKIEIFGYLDYAKKGDDIGIVLKNVDYQKARNMTLATTRGLTD